MRGRKARGDRKYATSMRCWLWYIEPSVDSWWEVLVVVFHPLSEPIWSVAIEVAGTVTNREFVKFVGRHGGLGGVNLVFMNSLVVGLLQIAALWHIKIGQIDHYPSENILSKCLSTHFSLTIIYEILRWNISVHRYISLLQQHCYWRTIFTFLLGMNIFKTHK